MENETGLAVHLLSTDPSEDYAPQGWQPIETFVLHGQANPVIIAVTHADRQAIVGEAWRHEDGEWWWAGTAPGDYYDDPISQTNYGQTTHWMPLPPPPSIIGGA